MGKGTLLKILAYVLVLCLLLSLLFVLLFVPESPLRSVLPFIAWPVSFLMPYFEEKKEFPRKTRATLALFFPMAMVAWLLPFYLVSLPQFKDRIVEPSIINGLLTASSICFAFTGTLFMREKTYLYHIITLVSADIISFVVLGYSVLFFGLDASYGLVTLGLATSSFSINAVTAAYLFFRHAYKLALKVD